VVSNSEYNLTELDSIRAKLSDARLIVNDRNRGYAGGVNRALIECRAPFIFILNPDCRLADKQTIELIKFMEQNQDIAVVGPKVVDERGVVQPSCRRFPRPWTFLMVRGYLRRFPFSGDERRRYLMEDFDHNTSRDTDWISGGAILVRKSAIDVVGGMDERFFLYMEDVDWCRRFWQAGFRVVYVPCCTVIHRGQHASIRGGIKSILSINTQLHLTSMAKYFYKYSFGSGVDNTKRP